MLLSAMVGITSQVSRSAIGQVRLTSAGYWLQWGCSARSAACIPSGTTRNRVDVIDLRRSPTRYKPAGSPQGSRIWPLGRLSADASSRRVSRGSSTRALAITRRAQLPVRRDRGSSAQATDLRSDLSGQDAPNLSGCQKDHLSENLSSAQEENLSADLSGQDARARKIARNIARNLRRKDRHDDRQARGSS